MDNIKKSQKIMLFLFVIMVIIIVGVYLFSPVDQPASAQSSKVDPRVTRLTKIIQLLDERINKSTSYEVLQANKLRRDYFAWQATELAKPTIEPTVLMNAKQTGIANATNIARNTTPLPTETREIGLFSGVGFVRGLSEEARLSQTYFIGIRDGEYITVIVGNMRDDPSQGAIYIFSLKAKGWEKFLLPEKVDTLRIISGDGSELELSDDVGKIFSFNLNTESFMNGLGTPIPSITPSPIDTGAFGTSYPEP